MRILLSAIGALAATGLVIGLIWFFWPISHEKYEWQETVSALIIDGECQSAMRLLRRLGMTDTEHAFEMWRTIRLEEGCGSGLLGVDPAEPLNSDEELFVHFIEERSWPQRREPFENLYTRPFPTEPPSIHEVIFYQRCGKTILSRSISDEFAVRAQVMEMELGTDLLKPWERRIRHCADLAYRIAQTAFDRAALANSRDVLPLLSYAVDLAGWAGEQGHPGAIRLTMEYTINRVSLLLFNFCVEEIEANLPSEFWWAYENLQPYLEDEGWAQHLYAEIWESGVLAQPNKELAYYWNVRASNGGEPVGIDLLRLQWQLGDAAARMIEERVASGEPPAEPRVVFPTPMETADCDGGN